MNSRKIFLNWCVPTIAVVLACDVAAQEVKGVNPAEIDSRADVIFKRVKLASGGTSSAWTGKYDYKLNNEWGLNVEVPLHTSLRASSLAVSGRGDVFARARWIVPRGDMTYGMSFETVLPTASDDALGTGRYQLNVGVLAVKPFSRSFIAAAVLKQTTSLGGDVHREKFSNTDVRIVPVWILSNGWAVSGELRQTWEHRSSKSWQRAELVLNKQFTSEWAGSLSIGRDFGDKPDKGAASVALKYFF